MARSSLDEAQVLDGAQKVKQVGAGVGEARLCKKQSNRDRIRIQVTTGSSGRMQRAGDSAGGTAGCSW